MENLVSLEDKILRLLSDDKEAKTLVLKELLYRRTIKFRSNKEKIEADFTEFAPNNILSLVPNFETNLDNDEVQTEIAFRMNKKGKSLGVRKEKFKQLKPSHRYKHKSDIDLAIVVQTVSQELEKFSDKTEIENEMYKHFHGRFKDFLTTQSGSRRLQGLIKQTNKEILKLILFELLPFLSLLMMDKYANYFMQLFYAELEFSMKLVFLVYIERYFPTIAKNAIGTYPLQTILSKLESEIEQNIVISRLENHLQELVYDKFGCFIVERTISRYSLSKIQTLWPTLQREFSLMIVNKNSLNSAKRMLERYRRNNQVEDMLDSILRNFTKVCNNKFGNLLLQHCLLVVF